MKTKSSGFYQNKDGSWVIDTKVKVNGEWKHFKKSGYASLSSAKADLERAKADFESKNSSTHAVMFFEDLVSEYERMRQIRVDISTCGQDICNFNVYMFPYFRGKLLKDVFQEDVIYEWYHNLIDTPKYTNNKKSKVITRMKDLLKFAYMHKYIDATTYQDCDVNLYQVKVNKQAKVERVIWEEWEEQAFIDTISQNKRDSILFRVFLCASPRLGEFLGLQGKSFEHDKNRLSIFQQVKPIQGRGDVLTDKLKTHQSYRTISLPKSLSDDLQNYIDTFGIRADDYLWFSTSKKSPMSRNTIRRLFDKYCALAKVRRMNLHALRHNQAVKLASVCKTGEELEVASRRLGHTPSVFMNIYANHQNEDKENELLERLNAA